MKYVLMVMASVLVLVAWLNSPGGAGTKRNLTERADRATSYMPVQ